MLGVPLIADGKLIGTVNLIRTKHIEPFNSIDQKLASDLAENVGDFVESASIREHLFATNKKLVQNLGDRFAAHGILGSSPAIKKVYKLLDQVIPTNARVVLLGESGTGKELVSKCIHYSGPRKDGPFVAIDCGALAANLLESELFGYVRGAFTGATQNRKGLIKEADGGTLFLDEITNMSTETQVKLLRVIQEEELRPLGSNRLEKVDIRIIVAASGNLSEQVAEGGFRSDLYFRLNVVSVHIPPLRERLEDIPILANMFLQDCAQKHGKAVAKLSPACLQILENYSWPGNIRELENVIERAVVMTHFNEKILMPEHLAIEPELVNLQNAIEHLPLEGDLPQLMAKYERKLLQRVLIHNNWNQSAAAKALGISEAVIRYKIKRLQLKPEKHKSAK